MKIGCTKIIRLYYEVIVLTNLHSMKNVILLLSFVIYSTLVSAKDITFNRLTKLYEKDVKQCLVVAKRYMKYLPDNASAYYFAAIIYKDKVGKARNTKSKYFHINKSLSYAKKFVARDNQEIMDRVDWELEVIELEETATEVIAELSQSEFSDLGIRLQKKMNAYEFMNTVLIAEYPKNESSPMIATTETMDRNSSAEIVKVSRQFYGMPVGTEIIRSYNKAGEQEVLRLVNAERKKQGMVELVWEEDLAKACRYHAYDLGTQDYFSHRSYDRINGKLVKVGGTFERIKKFYSNGFVNSENIAAGNESAVDTYQQWYNSSGHYDNMFNSSSRKVGIGVYKVPGSEYDYYWVFCTALN